MDRDLAVYSLCAVEDTEPCRVKRKAPGLRKSPAGNRLWRILQREFVKTVVGTTLEVNVRVPHADLVTTLQETYNSQLKGRHHLRALTCETIEAVLQELVMEGFLKREAPLDVEQETTPPCRAWTE